MEQSPSWEQMVAQLVRNSLPFMEPGYSLLCSQSPRKCLVSWARWIQSTSSQTISVTSILILSSHLCLATCQCCILHKAVCYVFIHVSITLNHHYRELCKTRINCLLLNTLCEISHSSLASGVRNLFPPVVPALVFYFCLSSTLYCIAINSFEVFKFTN